MTQARISVSLPSHEDREDIVERAKELGLTVSEYIRGLVAADLRPVRAADERAVLAAIERLRKR